MSEVPQLTPRSIERVRNTVHWLQDNGGLSASMVLDGIHVLVHRDDRFTLFWGDQCQAEQRLPLRTKQSLKGTK